MTEKKKLPKQKAASNYWAITEKDPSVFPNRSSDDNLRPSGRAQKDQQQRRQQEVKQPERQSIGTPVSLRRVVTIPSTDPSYAGNAFVERQRQRRERAQLRHSTDSKTRYVARTLAQTGMHAPTGRIPTAHRALPPQQSPVPARRGRQQPQHTHYLRLLSFLVIIAIVIVVIIFLLTSNVFRIAKVTVVGTHNITLIQHVQKMGIQGQNIFLLNVADLTTKINTLPQVSTVELSKQLPSQLVVSVQERIPVLLWQTTNGTFSVDNEGMIVASASDTVGANHLNTVIDMPQHRQLPNQAKSETALRPGTWLNKSDISFAVDVFKQLPLVTGTPLTSYKLYYNGTMYSSTNRTSADGVDKNGSYVLNNWVENWQAYLGSPSDPNPLSNRLLELHSILDLTQQQQQNVATIDLRYGLHPAFTLRNP